MPAQEVSLDIKGKIVPIGDRIAIDRFKEEYKGSIILPDSAKEQSVCGTVVGVGQNAPDEIEEGQVVFFKRDKGTEYLIDGRKVLIIKGDNVLGIYEE